MTIGIPLFDMSMWRTTQQIIPYEPYPDRFLAVSGRIESDKRDTLGIPRYVPTADALAQAVRRGWVVHGIWKPKVIAQKTGIA